jgi:hypothetical protein
MAIRGRAFLSEHANDNRFCYYKDGLRGGERHLAMARSTRLLRLRD